MKYLDEFRDGGLARGLAAAIAREVDPARAYRLMEFCGGHTHAIARYGLTGLLPANIQLIHGPGCPVCVLPVGRLQMAIELALRPGVILASYGDMLRVPGAGGDSLLAARARGADVRMVYAVDDALALARRHPQREVVFFAIGFETTTPPTAVAIRRAAAEGLGNFSVFCNHVLTPPAMAAILDAPEGTRLDGIIGPAHVSTVIGTSPYAFVPERHGKPVMVAGFEPLDVLHAVRLLVAQLGAGHATVGNAYTRVVAEHGNRKAQALMDEVFTVREQFEWRGLGTLAHSALRIRECYAAFDAERRFAPAEVAVTEHKGCECPAILRGAKQPQDCRLFGGACTPEHPLGACMVSSEGACAAHYLYGRWRAA
ncbi:hydrogenase maturation protein HypD [Plasticicumulans lactativorans]|uniref:Hydrogenase maturation factor n=1 Tax=Plasticicumulans lactativorans TaxID=1133106 RepID=A0A4R2LAQ9_9GAMM|nr:hydrogenase formation protein HypD [Plasticicumulans lactativorans]TCO76355.1 hydrogenase maturation protein HypD [Plasticicumulans lactativorans]